MIQFISHYTDKYTYLDTVRIALDGGCRWIQLRMKDVTVDGIRPMAMQVKAMCKEFGATFIIDDHVELVKEVGADGVHLGKNDMPIAEARKLLGNDFIIGATANTIDDVRSHYAARVDYIGCGPFRFTATKKNLSPVLGLEGYKYILKCMKEENINIPVVAIGGITAEDIPQIKQTGIDGIALSGSVLKASEPVREMKKLIEIEKRIYE